MIGDCVAWNPDNAPHEIVKNSNGKIGRFSGCKFCSVISGIGAPFIINPPPIPIALITSNQPKIG